MFSVKSMIDLHCHLLPGIDDGAPDTATSLKMARAAVADGIEIIACTPHILPGVYHNTGPAIRAATQKLQASFDREGVALRLVTGSDAHVTPNMVAQLDSGQTLSLADSRYVLVEPPHHVMPSQLDEFFFSLIMAGYVPILTHPERLSWVKGRFEVIERLFQAGTWMQITAGSLLGQFGRQPLYWAERMLDEGMVHVLASDAHEAERRMPILSNGLAAAAKRVGDIEALHMVQTRPEGILADRAPSNMPGPMRSSGYAGDNYAEAVLRSRERRHPVEASERVSRSGPRSIAGRMREFFRT